MFDANVKAILGEATVTVRDLVDMKVGDILTLNNRLGDDVELFVEEELKFYGKAGNLGKYRAVEIINRVISNAEDTIS